MSLVPFAAFCMSVFLVRVAQGLRRGGASARGAALFMSTQASGAASQAKLSVGSKLTNTDLAMEAVRSFFPNADAVKLTPTSGGVNNVVQYLELPDGKKKILRIYNNGLNTARVAFEHEVLKQLNAKYPSPSFRIPKLMPCLKDQSKSYVELSSGACACIVDIIEGGLPKLTCVRDIGRASGELNTMITTIKIDQKFGNGPTPPYYELFKVHHAVTRESFYKEMAGPSFDSVRSFATKMVGEIEDMERKIDSLVKLKLPFGLIHGDLHYDNVLVKDGRVTGLLDFEFASNDWRAMELAICLSKYAGEKDAQGNSIAMPFFTEFIDGFAEMGQLTDPEIEAIPDLINLRILSNVVYFVGRALGGEDDISSLTTRIGNYCGRVDWIKSNGDKIRDSIKSKMRPAVDL